MNFITTSQKTLYLLKRSLLFGIVIGLLIDFPSFSRNNVLIPPAGRILVILSSQDNMPTVVEAFEAAKAKINHQFPPDALIVTMPPAARLPSTVIASGIQVFDEKIDLAATSTWTGSAQQAARVWNALQNAPNEINELYRQGPTETRFQREIIDAFEAPPSQMLRTTDGDPIPSFGETSQFLIGSVAVGIVLPESNGKTDPSSEDWTAEERALVASEIVTAMEWWANLEPRANLSFVYDNIGGDTMPSDVEPISRSHSDQKYWIDDTMTGMGFSGTNYFDQVRNYNHHLRETYQTDWAFTIFVVDSSADRDNIFRNGYFAYAYLGGPFLVMTYGNQNYGPSNMDAVTAHEVGHIFRALDQYSSANQHCTLRAGYLNIENQNSQLGCLSNESSIMRGQVWPFINGQIDYYAQGQVGWRDSDGNNILDPVDVELTVNSVISSAKTLPNILTFNARLEEMPFDSPKYREVLINKLQSVRYRVDDGPWLAVKATDGTLDCYQEEITFTTDPLSSGAHTIYIRSNDNFGKINEQVMTAVTTHDPAENRLETEYNEPILLSDLAVQGDTYIFSGLASHLSEGLINNVQFRIDGSDWGPAQALDGGFDSASEAFEFLVDTADLETGDHLIQARAIDDQGYIDSSPATQTISIEPVQSGGIVYLPIVLRYP